MRGVTGKTVLRDEEREARLAEHKKGSEGKPLGDAVDAVLAATGESGSG
jgi:hypothetical protein